MSKFIIYLGSLLILTNTTIGLLISNYLIFNWLTVDVILIINTLLLFRLSSDNISHGYKISLSFLYPFLCILSVLLALLSPNKFKDNCYIIGLILIIIFELSIYLNCKKNSKF